MLWLARLLTRNQFTAVPVVHELQLPNEYGQRTIWISVYCTEYGAMYIAGRRSALVVTPDFHNRLIFHFGPAASELHTLLPDCLGRSSA